jgi:hypothetical protein
MQHSHEQYRHLAREYSDEAINNNTEDHNKKAYRSNLQENGYC